MRRLYSFTEKEVPTWFENIEGRFGTVDGLIGFYSDKNRTPMTASIVSQRFVGPNVSTTHVKQIKPMLLRLSLPHIWIHYGTLEGRNVTVYQYGPSFAPDYRYDLFEARVWGSKASRIMREAFTHCLVHTPKGSKRMAGLRGFISMVSYKMLEGLRSYGLEVWESALDAPLAKVGFVHEGNIDKVIRLKYTNRHDLVEAFVNVCETRINTEEYESGPQSLVNVFSRWKSLYCD